jgi:hypothetical protein
MAVLDLDLVWVGLSAIGVLLAIAARLAELAGLAPFAMLDHSVVRFGCAARTGRFVPGVGRLRP